MIRRHLLAYFNEIWATPLDEDVAQCHHDVVSAAYLVNSAIVVRRKDAVHLCPTYGPGRAHGWLLHSHKGVSRAVSVPFHRDLFPWMEIGRELHLGANALFALQSPGQTPAAGPLLIGR
jgi:hypothetical protein